ncbi:hypothetical protein RHS03_04343, partial [Rhizoctonia solani]
MRFSLCLLASAVVSCMTSVWCANVEGKIEWNSICSGINELKPNTVVVLDGGLYSGGVRRSGEFTISGVADGAYILSVLAPDHAFDFVRIDVDNNTVSAHPHVLGTPFELSVTGPTLSYPLTLSPRSKNVYFVPREGFNLAGMFQNPVSPALILLPGPLLTEDGRLDDVDDGSNGCDGIKHFIGQQDSMSEETKQELQQKQQDMFGITNAPASGLPKDLDVGSARAALTGGAKGGKNARRKK